MLSRFFFRADFQKFDLVKLRIYNYYYLIIFLADLNYKSASFYGITSNFCLLQIRRKSVARRCIVLITHFFPYWSSALYLLRHNGLAVFKMVCESHFIRKFNGDITNVSTLDKGSSSAPKEI